MQHIMTETLAILIACLVIAAAASLLVIFSPAARRRRRHRKHSRRPKIDLFQRAGRDRKPDA
jgi:hypothetical protein